MKIAVIPARGGSKRIPRKNINDFCGKPMIVCLVIGSELQPDALGTTRLWIKSTVVPFEKYL